MVAKNTTYTKLGSQEMSVYYGAEEFVRFPSPFLPGLTLFRQRAAGVDKAVLM